MNSLLVKILIKLTRHNFFKQKVSIIFLAFCFFFSFFLESSYVFSTNQEITNYVLNNELYIWLQQTAQNNISRKMIDAHEYNNIIKLGEIPPLWTF